MYLSVSNVISTKTKAGHKNFANRGKHQKAARKQGQQNWGGNDWNGKVIRLVQQIFWHPVSLLWANISKQIQAWLWHTMSFPIWPSVRLEQAFLMKLLGKLPSKAFLCNIVHCTCLACLQWTVSFSTSELWKQSERTGKKDSISQAKRKKTAARTARRNCFCRASPRWWILFGYRRSPVSQLGSLYQPWCRDCQLDLQPLLNCHPEIPWILNGWCLNLGSHMFLQMHFALAILLNVVDLAKHSQHQYEPQCWIKHTSSWRSWRFEVIHGDTYFLARTSGNSECMSHLRENISIQNHPHKVQCKAKFKSKMRSWMQPCLRELLVGQLEKAVPFRDL